MRWGAGLHLRFKQRKRNVGFRLIDLLFATACIGIGWLVGSRLACGLPEPLQLVAGWAAAGGVYFALVYPFYRGLRLRPMVLPRCPCCGEFQQLFQVLAVDDPRVRLRCPSCQGEFVVWLNGRPGAEETWETPVLALKWPYALGRYCKAQKPQADAPLTRDSNAE